MFAVLAPVLRGLSFAFGTEYMNGFPFRKSVFSHLPSFQGEMSRGAINTGFPLGNLASREGFIFRKRVTQTPTARAFL